MPIAIDFNRINDNGGIMSVRIYREAIEPPAGYPGETIYSSMKTMAAVITSGKDTSPEDADPAAWQHFDVHDDSKLDELIFWVFKHNSRLSDEQIQWEIDEIKIELELYEVSFLAPSIEPPPDDDVP